MKKSMMVSGMHLGTEFLSELYKEFVKRGGTEEQLGELLKTDSPAIPEFAERLVSMANGAKKLALKYLKRIGNIVVKTSASVKSSFFKTDGAVKLYFWDNFKSWILSAIPEEIPAFEGTVLKTQLTRSMKDSDIHKELVNPTPFAVVEFAAIIIHLLLKQAKGEDGVLLNNGYANIFYVQLADGRVGAVGVCWCSDDQGWGFRACDLGGGTWLGGHAVFSRS